MICHTFPLTLHLPHVGEFIRPGCKDAAFLDRPYLFPPPPPHLVGPVLCFLSSERRSCTLVTLITYPKRYWWPLIRKYSFRFVKLVEKGEQRALLTPSRDGWVSHPGLPGDLWAFALAF